MVNHGTDYTLIVEVRYFDGLVVLTSSSLSCTHTSVFILAASLSGLAQRNRKRLKSKRDRRVGNFGTEGAFGVFRHLLDKPYTSR